MMRVEVVSDGVKMECVPSSFYVSRDEDDSRLSCLDQDRDDLSVLDVLKNNIKKDDHLGLNKKGVSRIALFHQESGTECKSLGKDIIPDCFWTGGSTLRLIAISRKKVDEWEHMNWAEQLFALHEDQREREIMVASDVQSLTDESWFCATRNSEKIKMKLHGRPTGTFIMTLSPRADNLVLWWVVDGNKICKALFRGYPTGGYQMQGANYLFPSARDVIFQYTKQGALKPNPQYNE